MRARILCRPRPGSTLVLAVGDGESLVGRDPGNTVSVPMEGVSRVHAKITWDGKHHWIEDMKSTNGTFVNDQPVARERLRHLDVITLGKKADLLFVVRGGELPVVKKRGVVSATLTRDSGDAIPYPIGVGEITLGRSAACNVVADSSAVSSVHARIRRTAEELILEDLNSSNGTFVNGERVSATLLHDGDALLLGGVEAYRVGIGMGEVFSSGAYPKVDLAAMKAKAERPQLSMEWKTRYQWDSAEGLVLEEVRREVEARRQAKADAAAAAAVPKGKEGHGAKAASAKPAPAASKPAAPAAAPPKGAEGAKPVDAPKPAAAAAAPKATEGAKSVEPPKPAVPPKLADVANSATPPKPVVAPPKPAPEAPPKPAMTTTVLTAISELRLQGQGFDLAATEPGEYELGRAPEARLRVNHKTVSRRHARVVIGLDSRNATLQDAGGANGTLLNGVGVTQPTTLQDGDQIGLGEVLLTVRLKRR